MPNPPATKPPTGKPGGLDKKWWIVGGVGAVGIVWYATKHTKSAPVDPSVADPSLTADNSAVDPYATSAYDSGGFFGGSAPSLPTTDLQGNPTDPQTQQAWLLEAEAALLSMGFNPNAVQAALGTYANTGTDPTGAIASAAGAVGAPPGGASGAPTTVTTAPAPQPAAPTAPAAAPAKLPTMTAPALHGTATADHKARFSWNAIPGARSYHVYYAGVYHLYRTTTSFESAAHPKGFHYGPITVRAIRAADGKAGPASNAVTIVIK